MFNILHKIDSCVISYAEALFQKFGQATGLTNYFLLKILTGYLAVFIMIIIVVSEMYHVSSDTLHNVVLFAMAGYSFYLSFFYSDCALEKSIERHQTKTPNPLKSSEIFVRIRASMAVSVILLLGFSVFVLFAISEAIYNIILIVYIATSCSTVYIMWICLLLNTCDPLLQNKNPATQ